MKTADLTGAMLDYWVARAEGHSVCLRRFNTERGVIEVPWYVDAVGEPRMAVETYPEDWAAAGPIIEREQISLTAPEPPDQTAYPAWHANIARPEASWNATGPTPLIAAMRAFVASKFGDTVPECLSGSTPG